MKTRITFSSFGKNNKRGRKSLFLFVEMPNLNTPQNNYIDGARFDDMNYRHHMER